MDFVRGVSGCEEYAELFSRENIDGAVLALLTDSHLQVITTITIITITIITMTITNIIIFTITTTITTLIIINQGLGMKLGPALRLRAALAKRLGNCPHCRHCKHCHGQEEK